MTAPRNPAHDSAADVTAIRERLEAITGFEAIEHPNAGLTGRRELAELDTDGETWRLWDKNVPFSWKALTFIVHAPADIRLLLSTLDAQSQQLAAAEAALQGIANVDYAYDEMPLVAQRALNAARGAAGNEGEA